MVHFFRSNIAQKYGVNAAVLADFIWDCIEEKAHGSRATRGQGLVSLFGTDVDRVLSFSLL